MTAQDNKPTSLDDDPIGTLICSLPDGFMYGDSDFIRVKAAIAAYYEGLIPEKHFEMCGSCQHAYFDMTGRQPSEEMKKIPCRNASGFNDCVDIIHRNFTGQTDNERKQ